ncbi:hypothetical protein C8R44DRAFT_809994 [Mycena epipterygia]|nr:hypothetical protein C8R44DRAFT_809994 [Mycena epipterygia]
MVLTRRAYRAISRWLPNEVITEIIQAAPQKDRTAICRTSKLFYGLSVPVLYRVVDIDTHTSLSSFSAAISSNPNLAKAVRSFTFINNFRLSWLSPRLMKESLDFLKPLLRLERISIELHLFMDAHDAFLHLTFPHLTSCHVARWHEEYRPTGEMLVSYLMRHPALEHVSFPEFPLLPNFALETHRIQLLNLQKFHGPHELIPLMVTSGLRDVRISFDDEISIDVEAIFVALKSRTHTDVPFVFSHFMLGDRYFPALIDSISRNIPHTESIKLLLYGNPPPHNDFISLLRNCLPRFTCLTFVAVLFSGALGLDLKAEDQISLQQTWDLCPTLEECRLTGRTWKKIQGMWEEKPAEQGWSNVFT